MGLFKNIKNVWNLASMCNDIPMYDTLKHMDFFSFTGGFCSPGFCLDLSSCSGIDQAYYKCSPLSTIIGRNAMAMANGKWWITDKKDNDKSDKYKNISKLLENPNPVQSFTEFIIQLDTYRQLYGEAFIIANVPVGLSIQDATSLWVIKPSYIEIEKSNKLYLQSDLEDIVIKYYLDINGQKTEIDKDHILHIKDIYQNLNFCPTDLRGKSRIMGLEDPIRNIIQAYEAIYTLNRDRGAQGILSNSGTDTVGPIPITEEEKKSIQEQYLSRYGLKKNQSKVIITEAALRWQQMSFNVKDLMLFEGLENNIKQLSNALGYPYNLLSEGSQTQYNNQQSSDKRLYQDNTIPISIIYSERFTNFFQLGRDRIYIDFDHVLREADSEKALTLQRKIDSLEKVYRLGVISLEEFRLAIDYDEQISGITMYNGNEGQNTEDTGQETN